MSPKDRGSILVLSLWVLLMLSTFSLSLSFGVRQRATLLNRLTTLDALYPIAYSGVEAAKSLVKLDVDLTVDLLTDVWVQAILKNVDVANGYFVLGSAARPGLVDEERKINLNATSAEILSRLFQTVAGLSRQDAEEVAYALIDWMDSDSFFGHPQYGAEASYYENLKFPYTAKNKPYEFLDEMLLVKGMTPEIFEKIKPFVTVHGSGQVNIHTVSGEVLSALGFSPVGVETIVRYRAGTDEIDGTPDDNFFLDTSVILKDLDQKGKTPLDSSQEVMLASLLTASRLNVVSSVFSVISHAVFEKNNASLDVEAVIDRAGNVRDWRSLGVPR